MAKIVIGITGQIACGKGAIKKYLMEKYGADDFRFSTMLRDVLNRLQIETSRENLQTISFLIRSNFGEDTLAKAMAHDLKNSGADLVVVEGIRRLADIKYLREVPGFKLIRVVVNEKLRYERVVSRNENKGDDQKTYEQFLTDQNAEAEKEIPTVMAAADYEIVNEGTMADLERDTDNIIADIKNKNN